MKTIYFNEVSEITGFTSMMGAMSSIANEKPFSVTHIKSFLHRKDSKQW